MLCYVMLHDIIFITGVSTIAHQSFIFKNWIYFDDFDFHVDVIVIFSVGDAIADDGAISVGQHFLHFCFQCDCDIIV